LNFGDVWQCYIPFRIAKHFQNKKIQPWARFPEKKTRAHWICETCLMPQLPEFLIFAFGFIPK